MEHDWKFRHLEGVLIDGEIERNEFTFPTESFKSGDPQRKCIPFGVTNFSAVFMFLLKGVVNSE